MVMSKEGGGWLTAGQTKCDILRSVVLVHGRLCKTWEHIMENLHVKGLDQNLLRIVQNGDLLHGVG